MTRIAHISDLHLDGTPKRANKLAAALDRARTLQPDHLLVTGDITANGRPSELRELREALERWTTPKTVIAGNHDGHLTGFVTRSFDHPDVRILPVDTRSPRRALAFSALGQVAPAQLRRIERETREPGRPVVLAMHHGPHEHPLSLFAGLLNMSQVLSLCEARPWVHVLCGHDHRSLDFGQVHVAPSVAHHPDPVRVYDVREGRVVPVYQSAFEGDYFT